MRTPFPVACVLVLAALLPPARAAEVGRRTHEPRMTYLDNGTIRLGADLNLGGAITWLSTSGEGKPNLVNSWDWGRQVQMSHYAGPVPFAPGGKRPAAVWRDLGWNPVQAGDHFGNRSRVLEHRNDKDGLYVKCVPMQWPLENEPAECAFESRFVLDGPAVRATCRLVNARADKTQYAARTQELPAVYTNGPWWQLMTYSGDKPFAGGELTQVPAKFPWSHFDATENWAALVDDNGWGLGVWAPGVYAFSGGFAGKPGAGGEKDDPTGYIAPNRREVIDHDIAYEFRYDLILGTLEQIRRHVYDRSARPAPPAYRFAADRQHWWYHDATDAGWPVRGELDVRPAGPDPYLVGPAGFWPAADGPKLLVEAAFHTEGAKARVRWRRHDDGRFDDDKMVWFTVVPDGQYRVYEVDLSASPGYRGAITGLRIDPPAAGTEGRLRVKSVSFANPTTQPAVK